MRASDTAISFRVNPAPSLERMRERAIGTTGREISVLPTLGDSDSLLIKKDANK